MIKRNFLTINNFDRLEDIREGDVVDINLKISNYNEQHAICCQYLITKNDIELLSMINEKVYIQHWYNILVSELPSDG